MSDLPPCGIYRTRQPIGTAVPAGRLVFFHNHGQPGPGVYLPDSWRLNRAQWRSQGTPIPDPAWAQTLEPLAPEGLYRVREAFHCCERRCQLFEPDRLVQLGYDGEGQPILFSPEWTTSGLAIPETGTAIDVSRVAKLDALKVPEHQAPPHDVQ